MVTKDKLTRPQILWRSQRIKWMIQISLANVWFKFTNLLSLSSALIDSWKFTLIYLSTIDDGGVGGLDFIMNKKGVKKTKHKIASAQTRSSNLTFPLSILF